MAVQTPTPPLEEIGESRARGVQPPKVTLFSYRSRGAVSQPEDRVRSREIQTPFLLDRDVCLVRNVDEVPWEFKYDRRHYKIDVGKEGLVPFPALVNALGDPRSVPNEQTRFRTENGETGIILTRHDSIRTLFARYSVENENVQDLVDFAPRVEVFHQETGQAIVFPAQDPDCRPWPVPQHAQPGRENMPDHRLLESVAAENKELRGELAEMREMMQSLMAQKAPVGVADVAAGVPQHAPQHAAPAPGPTPPPPADPFAAPAGEDPLAASLLGGAPVDTGPGSTFTQ
jgi:hypothetical protein